MKQIYCPTLPEKTQKKLKKWYTVTCYTTLGMIIVLIGATAYLMHHKKACTTQRTSIIQKTQTTSLPTHLLKQLTTTSHTLCMAPALLLHLISTTQPPHTTITQITATPATWDIKGNADSKDTVHLFIKELSKGLRKQTSHATCALKQLTSHNDTTFFVLHLDI